jgi:uncharacterized protein YprB with RNaseH-like and TPR domain
MVQRLGHQQPVEKVEGGGQVQVFGQRFPGKNVVMPKIGPDPDFFNRPSDRREAIMLSETLRARLSQLNREVLPADAEQPAPPKLKVRRPPAKFLTLAEAAPGVEVANASGKHWRVRAELAELWPQGPSLVASYRRRLRLDAASRCSEYDEMSALAHCLPKGMLVLDLETCGFAGSAVFLIGLLHHDGQSLVLDQLLARDWSEEPAILRTMWDIAAECEVLLTFNGKTFDWPMVHDRTTLHRLMAEDARPQLMHCDLLHHARRRWRDEMPNCKLQTLERMLCGRHRAGDIPGSEIPAAYADFVRSGNARQIEAILHHNALDLVTLCHLSLRLASGA